MSVAMIKLQPEMELVVGEMYQLWSQLEVSFLRRLAFVEHEELTAVGACVSALCDLACCSVTEARCLTPQERVKREVNRLRSLRPLVINEMELVRRRERVKRQLKGELSKLRYCASTTLTLQPLSRVP